MPKWRKGCVFDMHGSYRTRLDRNARARVIAHAEAMERRTKQRGKRDGLIGQSGLAVLRAMVFGFLNTATGRLDPSYKAIQKRTGFCMATIARAVRMLETAGIMKVTRRMIRVTGGARQTTSAYQVRDPQPQPQDSDSGMRKANTSIALERDIDPESAVEKALRRMGMRFNCGGGGLSST